jgi:hypothetical protein
MRQIGRPGLGGRDQCGICVHTPQAAPNGPHGVGVFIPAGSVLPQRLSVPRALWAAGRHSSDYLTATVKLQLQEESPSRGFYLSL